MVWCSGGGGAEQTDGLALASGALALFTTHYALRPGLWIGTQQQVISSRDGDSTFVVTSERSHRRPLTLPGATSSARSGDLTATSHPRGSGASRWSWSRVGVGAFACQREQYLTLLTRHALHQLLQSVETLLHTLQAGTEAAAASTYCGGRDQCVSGNQGCGKWWVVSGEW